MLDRKNSFMLWFSAAAVLLSVIIFPTTRMMYPWQDMHGILTQHSMGEAILIILPFISFMLAYSVFLIKKDHVLLRWLHTLTLSFSSISMISGSGGHSAYYFSVFIVIAMIASYDDIRLVLLTNFIFTMQHAAGYFFFSEILLGSAEYEASKAFIHIAFLTAISGAKIWQIRSKQAITERLENEKREKEERLNQLLVELQGLTKQIGNTSDTVLRASYQAAHTNKQMRFVCEEMTGGLGDQAYSIELIESNLSKINHAVQASSDSMEMKIRVRDGASGVTAEMVDIAAVIEEGMASLEQLTEACERQIEESEQVDQAIRQLNQLSIALQQRLHA
ncbi:methyl-accepting chemotaxis protein [Paenibacillus endophyticus]|uniref:Methyl-accepting chemotaxis protein n=1 Tax=Paenibacillus endophyticus TaxID=1294268 RepID=A0A7W5CA56_9BACL|nr:methyl-accepting chemotaxis protein [Paenibacillus endophyticus]MBB3153976.1 methyl-accepting chemotaxis protein [Paenibacillus endophyticus]